VDRPGRQPQLVVRQRLETAECLRQPGDVEERIGGVGPRRRLSIPGLRVLEGRDRPWAGVGVEDVSRFVAWLRAPADNVVVLETGTGRRSAATVNKHLAAVFSFYDYHARNGVVLAQALVAWRRSNRNGYKPFLHHVTAGRPVPGRPLRLRQPRHLPRTLSADQVLVLVEACDHLRDRFLLVLLAETGMRIGQALGLRHSDFVSHRRELRIVPRPDNLNGARAKTIDPATIPISAGVS